MPALLELQRSFAGALLGVPRSAEAWIANDGLSAAARLRVYRNNARALFDQALQVTFPVVLQRVGPDYFRQLAHHFRTAYPSRTGDLHEVGRPFATFLAEHLSGTPYAWLAELAALEWAVAEAGVTADSACATVNSLAAFPPEAMEAVRFRFVPSLRRVVGSIPVLSVWRANQPDAQGGAVDLSAGAEYVIVHRGAHDVELRAVPRSEFALITVLARGATLGAAIEEADISLEDFAGVLHWLFARRVVATVIPPSAS